MARRAHLPIALGILILIGLGLLAVLRADPETVEAGPASFSDTIPDHALFSEVLERVVHPPQVDYALLQEEREPLDRYLTRLAATSGTALEEASDPARLAFWINAYNACMLRLVIDHYPIEPGGTGLFGAIRNRVAGYPDNSVWQIPDVFTREHCRVAGADRSQDEIEHQIIRPRFGDPRIHFAVNCAAVSCPVLWPEAYEEERLDEQLDRAVRNLIDDPRHFRLEPGPPPVLTLNRVLDWYIEDFGGEAGLVDFFREHVDGPPAARLATEDVHVEFFEYDWTLNDVDP